MPSNESRLAKLSCTASYYSTLQTSLVISNNAHRSKLKRTRKDPELSTSITELLLMSPTIKKEDFSKMQIIGQFNKGFIITLLAPHLYVIDQHASDEIFNYETYLQKYTFSTQLLVKPVLLEWSPQLKSSLHEQEQAVRKVGWRFDQSRSDVMLTGVPFVKNLTFSALEEWLCRLSTGEKVSFNQTTKPKRFFASKACRTSVMIGTVLKRNKMKIIVDNLGLLSKPWNCPHGRPTMRHLYQIASVDDAL